MENTNQTRGVVESWRITEEAISGRNDPDKGTSTVSYALAYAKLGFVVFPLAPGTKNPLSECVPHGHLEATSVVMHS